MRGKVTEKTQNQSLNKAAAKTFCLASLGAAPLVNAVQQGIPFEL